MDPPGGALVQCLPGSCPTFCHIDHKHNRCTCYEDPNIGMDELRKFDWEFPEPDKTPAKLRKWKELWEKFGRPQPWVVDGKIVGFTFTLYF
jgi:hypothetical protein